MKKFKPAAKHLAIIEAILTKGYYRPIYSECADAIDNLEQLGIVHLPGGQD